MRSEARIRECLKFEETMLRGAMIYGFGVENHASMVAALKWVLGEYEDPPGLADSAIIEEEVAKLEASVRL